MACLITTGTETVVWPEKTLTSPTLTLPPAVIACNIESLNLLKKEPWRRKELLKCADFFRTTLKTRGFNVKGSSQIVPLILGDNFKAIAYARGLQNKGYWVMPIRPPTVPDTQARLRFSLTFYHEEQILQKLINDLSNIGI